MQTLLKILLRYSNFLVFIALEVAAFMLISLNNAAPRSSMLSTANNFIAWQYEQISEVRGYFSLRSQNELLAAEMLNCVTGFVRWIRQKTTISFITRVPK